LWAAFDVSLRPRTREAKLDVCIHATLKVLVDCVRAGPHSWIIVQDQDTHLVDRFGSKARVTIRCHTFALRMFTFVGGVQCFAVSPSIGGESTLDLCYASPDEIPERQRPRRATGNRRNLQCGDDSIMRANATRDTGSPCLGAVGASVWGSALLVVGFSVMVSILLRSLNMSGAALSTRLMRALRLRGSCS